MKELLKSKAIILFIVFMIGVTSIQEQQIKMDSVGDVNLAMNTELKGF